MRLFGGPRITVEEGGEPISLSPFQAALVALVWVGGRVGVPRSRVTWLLWEEEDDTTARHRVSQLLYGISRKMRIEPIIADGDSLLPSPDLDSDLARLRRVRGTKPVSAEPLALLRPPLPSGAFEEWLTRERATLKYLAIDRNSELLTEAEEAHDYPLAASTARAILGYDPVNERALRSLMKALALNGSALQAETAFEAQAEIVERIIPDWRPSRETRRLLHELDALRRRQQGPPTGADMRHPVRLVGRRDELSLARTLCLGGAAPWRDLVIAGEPGVGKSRILEEVGRQLELEDCRVCRVRSFGGEDASSFNLMREIAESEPFREAIRTLAPMWRKVLSVSLILNLPDVEDVELMKVPVDSASRRVHEALRRMFEAVEGRVVLLADALDNSDASSLAALAFLRNRTSQSTIRLVGTVTAEAERAEKPHAEALRALTTEMHERIDLRPLGEEHALALAAAATEGRGIPPERIAEIARQSGGNPLFVIELAHSEAEAEELPHSLSALVERRVSRLAPGTRVTLDILSAQTRPLSLEELRRICDTGAGELLASVNEGVAHRLVTTDEVGVSFRHGVIQGWIYDQLSASERRFIHGVTAMTLAEVSPDSAVDIAHHFHRAGRNDDAYRWSTKGAETAEAQGAILELTALLRLGELTAPTLPEKCRILCKLGILLYRQGALSDSVAVDEKLASLNEHIPSDSPAKQVELLALRARAELGILPPAIVITKLGELQAYAQENNDQGLALDALDAQVILANGSMQLDLALRILNQTKSWPEIRSRSDLCRKCLTQTFYLLYGDHQLAWEAAKQALDIIHAGEARGLSTLVVSRFIIVGSWSAKLGQHDIEKLLTTASDHANKTGDYKHLLNVYVNLSTWLLDIGSIDRAATMLDDGAKLLEKISAPELRSPLLGNIGELLLLKREYEGALEYFSAAVAYRSPARMDSYLNACAGLGLAYLGLGRFADAKAAHDEIKALADAVAGGENINFDPSRIVRLHCRILKIEGRTEKALEYAGVVCDRLRDRHIPAWIRNSLFLAKLLRQNKKQGWRPIVASAKEQAERVALDELARRCDRLLG